MDSRIWSISQTLTMDKQRYKEEFGVIELGYDEVNMISSKEHQDIFNPPFMK